MPRLCFLSEDEVHELILSTPDDELCIYFPYALCHIYAYESYRQYTPADISRILKLPAPRPHTHDASRFLSTPSAVPPAMPLTTSHHRRHLLAGRTGTAYRLEGALGILSFSYTRRYFYRLLRYLHYFISGRCEMADGTPPYRYTL